MTTSLPVPLVFGSQEDVRFSVVVQDAVGLPVNLTTVGTFTAVWLTAATEGLQLSLSPAQSSAIAAGFSLGVRSGANDTLDFISSFGTVSTLLAENTTYSGVLIRDSGTGVREQWLAFSVKRLAVPVDVTQIGIKAVTLQRSGETTVLTGLATAGPVWLRPWSAPEVWNPLNSYVTTPIPSCVTYNGSTYVCIVDHGPTAVFDISKWFPIALAGGVGPTGPMGSSGGRSFNTTVAGVATGLSMGQITPGTGGLNGTYNKTVAAPAGGTPAVVQFVVSGNVVSSATVTTIGANFTTPITLTNADLVSAGATGLTNAQITLFPGGGVGFTEIFWIPSPTNSDALDGYYNNNGTAVLIGQKLPAYGPQQIIGNFPALGTGTPWAARQYCIDPNTTTINGVADEMSIGTSAGASGWAFTATRSGSVFTLVDMVRFTSKAGLDTVEDLGLPVSIGMFCGAYVETGVFLYNSGGSIYQNYGTALQPTLTIAATTGVKVSLGFKVVSGLSKKLADTTTQLASLTKRLAVLEKKMILDPYSSTSIPTPRMIFLGDSIIQAGDSATVSVGYGEFNWAHAVWPYFDKTTWYDTGDALGRNISGANLGMSGYTCSMALANSTWMGMIHKQAADMAVIAFGANDLFGYSQSAATMWGYIQTLITYCRRFIPIIILCTCRPFRHSYAGWNSTKEAERVSYNNTVRNYANSTPNTILIDFDIPYDDGTGEMKAGYTVDGLHPSTSGAQQAGIYIATVLRKFIKSVPYFSSVGNIVPNPNYTSGQGTGVPGLGVTGTVADYMSAYFNAAGPTAVASLVPTTEGKFAQQFVVTPGGAASSNILQFGVNGLQLATPPNLANKWVKVTSRVNMSAWNGWRHNFVYAQPYGGGLYAGGATDTLDSGGTFWIETDPILLPAVPQNLSIQLVTYINCPAATGTGTLKFDEFCVQQISDPRPARGY